MFGLSPDEIGILALSLRVALVSVICSLPLAILVAYGLARFAFPGKTLVDAIVHLPLVLPPVVVGFALLVLLGKRGPIGSVLDDWFGIVFAFRWTGAALASALMGFPLMVRAIRLSIEAIDQRLEVAARTLGGSRSWVFASITLPLALPGIITGTLLSFARGLGEFGATITFVSNIPGETQTLPLAIYTFTQVPGGDAQALRLSIIAVDPVDRRAGDLRMAHAALRRGSTAMIDVDIEQQLGAFRLAVAVRRRGADRRSLRPLGRGQDQRDQRHRRNHARRRAATFASTEPRCSIRRQGIDLPPEARRIGYVFQDALLFPHMDVEANLLYGQRLAPGRGSRHRPQRGSIELLGLGALLRRKTATLSGGEKQRVAIGRALLAQPRILLLDEPLAALDVPRKTEILDYIERLRDELHIPIVYVSHSVAEISRLADTVVVLSDGSVPCRRRCRRRHGTARSSGRRPDATRQDR